MDGMGSIPSCYDSCYNIVGASSLLDSQGPSMGFSGYNAVQDGNNLSSFSPVPAEDKKLYSRNSFGGVYNYRDSAMESCDFPLRSSLADSSRNDLTMSNLQDVMEENLFSPTQPLSSVASVGPTLSTPSSTPSFFSGKDGLNSGSASALGGFGMGNLKSGYGGMMSHPLSSSSSNGFMLSSFDNDDFARSCWPERRGPPLDNNPLTPPSLPSSFTPMKSMYGENGVMMNDFVSDSGYSPRAHYSPVPTSPYVDAELSPHHLLGVQSASSNCLMMP